MIGKLTTIIGFLRDFFSFFNTFLIPQAKTMISTAVSSYDILSDMLSYGQLQFQPLLIGFIMSVIGLCILKLVLNR